VPASRRTRTGKTVNPTPKTVLSRSTRPLRRAPGRVCAGRRGAGPCHNARQGVHNAPSAAQRATGNFPGIPAGSAAHSGPSAPLAARSSAVSSARVMAASPGNSPGTPQPDRGTAGAHQGQSKGDRDPHCPPKPIGPADGRFGPANPDWSGSVGRTDSRRHPVAAAPDCQHPDPRGPQEGRSGDGACLCTYPPLSADQAYPWEGMSAVRDSLVAGRVGYRGRPGRSQLHRQ
jgi:hypothetical protein